MNKPAPREPSMDEILSSIRQIIADDDAGGGQTRRAAPSAASLESMLNSVRASAAASTPAPAAPAAPAPRFDPDPDDVLEPLALSPEQIVSREDPEPEPMAFERPAEARRPEPTVRQAAPSPELVDPEDLTFDAAEEAAAFREPEVPEMDLEPELPPARPAPQAAPRPAPMSVSQVAPMPDPALSRDMAEKLIEPATDAAVKHAFTRLNALALGAPSVTIESIVREMLRPLLKDWLDEHLPAVVERMVEKEIARISRGGF